MSPALTLELAHLKSSHQPHPLHLNTYDKIHRKWQAEYRQLRLQLDHSLRYNNFYGIVEKLKQKNQSTRYLSQLNSILNRLSLLSLVKVINCNRHHLLLPLIRSHFFSSALILICYFSCFIFYAKCRIVPNSTLTASGRSLSSGPVWRSTQSLWLRFKEVIRRKSSVCFSHLFYNINLNGISSETVIFKSTLTLPQWQTFTNFYFYHSLEYLDPIMEEVFIFIHTSLSSLPVFPPTSTVLAETTNGKFHSS